jgi:hypothetical protein
MIAAPIFLSAPESAPSLEAGFILVRAAARAAPRPAAVLAGAGSIADKLSAIDTLHDAIPTEPKPRQIAALDQLAAAASSAAQPPEVRAKALTSLGYAMPQVADDAARGRALTVLLGALGSPAYRVYALRGLGPACHGLPKADEARLQSALLDLLDGPVAGEERQTALVALFSFVSTREDLAKRDPALVAQLDSRLIGPAEANPAAFISDPRATPGARSLVIAVIWSSARHRQALGEPAAAARVNALLDRLLTLERDPEVRAWLQSYRNAAPPAPVTLRDITTSRAPAGPDEP